MKEFGLSQKMHEPHRAHIGGMTPEVLAQLLVSELIERDDSAH